jgi:hypothetical protein
MPEPPAFSVVAIVIVDRGHSPLRMLLVSLLATLNALPGALDGEVGWCLPAAAWCRLPAS